MQERGPVPPLSDEGGAAAATPVPGRGRLVAIAVAVAACSIAVDQATKTWAEHALADRTIHLVWTLRLALTYNSGAAFSIGRGYGPYFMLAGVVALIVVLSFGHRTLLRSTLMAVALGLVVGGALGNVVDRVLRDNAGTVIDFIDLRWWPVFNVADSCLSVGGVLLVLSGLRE